MWWTAVFEPVWTVSILPSNSTAWERTIEAVDADLVARDPIRLVEYARSDIEVPDVWLPYLAEERSVDEFSSAWTEERRRAVTRGSFPLHQVKGTRPALDRALVPLGFSPQVTEWFETSPTRQPNTFRISVTIDEDRDWIFGRSEIIRVANKAKNLHTKLEAIEARREVGPSMVYVGGYSRRIRTIRVGQLPKVELIRTNAMVFIGAVSTRRRTLRVGPRT